MRLILFIFSLFAFLLPATTQADSFAGVTVHRFAATERAYATNAYWLESATGLVLIDALMLNPDAEDLALLLKARQKPLAAIFLTHPHVDHFGGLSVLRRHFPDTPVIATASAAAEVARVHERAFADGWIQSYGADYNKTAVTPDRLVADGDRLVLAGLNFTVHAYGPMEAAENLLIYNKETDAIFGGDTVLNGPLYYLGEGHSATALQGLARIALQFPPNTRVYPGHGDAGFIGAMVEDNASQIRYMRERFIALQQIPQAVLSQGRLSDTARARLAGMFSEHFAGRYSYGVGLATLIRMNIAGLEQELLPPAPAEKPVGSP